MAAAPSAEGCRCRAGYCGTDESPSRRASAMGKASSRGRVRERVGARRGRGPWRPRPAWAVGAQRAAHSHGEDAVVDAPRGGTGRAARCASKTLADSRLPPAPTCRPGLIPAGGSLAQAIDKIAGGRGGAALRSGGVLVLVGLAPWPMGPTFHLPARGCVIALSGRPAHAATQTLRLQADPSVDKSTISFEVK